MNRDQNRDQISQQLRLWADEAQHEAYEADTREDMLSWQGQAQVLGSVSTFLAGSAMQSDTEIWEQVTADRSGALASWEKAQEGPDAMLYSGVVAGYDLVLTTLRNMTGKTWVDVNRRTGWVNR